MREKKTQAYKQFGNSVVVPLIVMALKEAGGVVPTTMDGLKKLPGVGDYAAAAFTTFQLNASTTLIDSNIVRLYGRFFGFATGPETRRNRAFRSLAAIVQPRRDGRRFGFALLDFTRSICTPRPHCDICPLRKRCVYGLARSTRPPKQGDS